MRKFKLMPFILLGSVFGLSACTLPKWLSFLSFIPGLEAPEEEEGNKPKKPEDPEEEGVSFSFSDFEEAYAELGFEGVVIPDYQCADSKATLTQPYPEDSPTMYLVKPSTVDEMQAFGEACEDAGWTMFVDEEYGDLYGIFGEQPEAGESVPYISIEDWNEYPATEPLGGIVLRFQLYTAPSTSFPGTEISEDLAKVGVTASVPVYSGEAEGFQYFPYDEDYGYAQLQILVEEGSEESAAAEYESVVTGAGYTYVRQDYGFNVYASADGTLEICVWQYGNNTNQTVYVDLTPTVSE